MNLDLLKKLVLLANHNNTEGEANSAARKVCRMIEEGGFKFDNDYKAPSSSPFPGAKSWDFWEQIRKEQEESAKRREASRQEEERKEEERKRKEEEARKNESFHYRGPKQYKPYGGGHYGTAYDHIFVDEVDEDFNFKDFYKKEKSNMKGEGILRICVKCGLEVKTFDRGLVFICFACKRKE